MTIFEFILSGICWGAIWLAVFMLIDVVRDMRR